MVDSSSASTRSSLFAIPSYDDALFKRIHEAPTYLTKHENEESANQILKVLAAITILHLLLLFIMKMLIPSSSSQTQKSKQETSKAAWKASYQLTNLLVNLLLGSLGIYYELLSNSHTDHSILNKIIGYSEIRYFAIIQIGYQLWALPIGILFVGEQTSMIIHHVAVIAVASVSCFLTCGFRYFNPYFYGFIEISSVPLSVMNAFKNNREWIKKYPGLYSKVRLVFGLTFLLVRVIIWTPHYWDFFTLCMLLLRSSHGSTRIILALFNMSSLVLTILQYFWASKIVSAMVKGGPKKKEKKV